MKYCTNCGTENNDENQVCNQCQTPLKNESISETSTAKPTTPITESPPEKQSRPKGNKKKVIIILLAIISAIIIFCILVFTHVICFNHDWLSATCVEPAQCWKCDRYKDDVLGNHHWVQATCTEPKHCSYCYLENGESLGHDWQDATCEMPKSCLVCEQTSGVTLEHSWKEATCEAPKTCELCGATEGSTTEHIEDDWVTTQEATLTEEGSEELLCSVCGDTLDSRDIDEKSPEVDGKSFNFTDEEFIDWMNDTTNSYVGYSDLSDGDMGDNTLYRIEFDGEVGGIILNHGDNGKYGNVCAIMVWFDEWSTSAAIAAYIGGEIDSDFSTDDALYLLIYGDSYTKGDLTTMLLDLDDNFVVATLAPNEFFEDILS